MSTILHLPEDILRIILNANDINIRDVISLSLTCKQLYCMITKNNSIWRKKFYQRWSHLKTICEKEIQKNYIDFRTLTMAHLASKKELQSYLTQLSFKYYRSPDEYMLQEFITVGMQYPHFKDNIYIDEIDNLLRTLNRITYPLSYHFFMDELTSLVEQESEDQYNNLTNLYYGKKLFPFLKHYHLRKQWQEFISRPVEQQLLEEAATFVAQWYQPDKEILFSQITTELDNIAQQVLEHLRIVHSMHPIFLISQEQFSFWKYNNIIENHWNDNDGRQIIYAVCKILSKLNFQTVTCSENTILDTDFILLNKVLENNIGYIMSLAIIFQSVIRRLGVRCDLVSFPSHCFLSWKPKYNVTNHDSEQCFYIDIFNNTILSATSCPRIRGVAKCPIEKNNKLGFLTPVELIIKLIRYIQMSLKLDIDSYVQTRWLVELQHLVKPDDIDTIMQLNYYYQKENINTSILITALEKIKNTVGFDSAKRAKFLLEKLQNNKILQSESNYEERKFLCVPKERTLRMNFAVGMIVKIKNQNNKPGVIFGWEDEKFSVPIYSSQCCYMIMCDHNELHCIKEEFLEKINESRTIEKSVIGKYFCEFRGTYYMPNKALANEYPDDILFLSKEL